MQFEDNYQDGVGDPSRVYTFGNLERLDFPGGMSMLTIPVPHDDSDNVGIIASDGRGSRAGIVTDLGEATRDLVKQLSGCNHISIEAEYDHSRLLRGPYPDSLKRRISRQEGVIFLISKQDKFYRR